MPGFPFILVLASALLQAFSHAASAATAVPPAEPTVEQRLADIEAYIKNSPRATDGKAASKISGAGPAHNAWMMVSAALVLFMTLPGLALFYGGLVRSKNVLSVLAQCFGLAGMVAILWWAVGYSLSFGKAGPMCGGTGFAFMNGVDDALDTFGVHAVGGTLGSMRATVETERVGLDLAEHGEEGYHH